MLRFPASPPPLDPQQYMTPVAAIAQEWVSPTASALNERPPETAVGTTRCTVSARPSWPKEFEPQQYAVLSVVSPQVCVVPAVRLAHTWLPDTGIGIELLAVVPSPSEPL